MSCSLDQPAQVHEVVWDHPDERRTFPSLTAFIVAATADLKDRYVWLSDDRVLLRRDVAALRRSAGGSGG